MRSIQWTKVVNLTPTVSIERATSIAARGTRAPSLTVALESPRSDSPTSTFGEVTNGVRIRAGTRQGLSSICICLPAQSSGRDAPQQ